jgi:hypothetical protein
MSMTDPYIPRRTREEMQNPAPPGHRHHQALKIAVSLIGQGLSPHAVFAHLREMHAQATDFTDREIRSLIDWAVAQNPSPCGGENAISRVLIKPRPDERVTPKQAIRNAEEFLKGWRCDEADLWHVSRWYPGEDFRKDAGLLIAALYGPGDYINVVSEFVSQRQADGKEKACPRGAGITFRRDDWLRRLASNLPPQSAAGTWIRPNPVKELRGSGHGGAYTDKDVATHRFLLLESDDLPKELQLSFWARLALPVTAIIDSGGRSVHAWIKLDCKDEAEYSETASFIYERLTRFGLCLNNRNPSRLARLPGVKRRLGAVGAGEQRLYFLDPDPRYQPIFKEEEKS